MIVVSPKIAILQTVVMLPNDQCPCDDCRQNESHSDVGGSMDLLPVVGDLWPVQVVGDMSFYLYVSSVSSLHMVPFIIVKYIVTEMSVNL